MVWGQNKDRKEICIHSGTIRTRIHTSHTDRKAYRVDSCWGSLRTQKRVIMSTWRSALSRGIVESGENMDSQQADLQGLFFPLESTQQGLPIGNEGGKMSEGHQKLFWRVSMLGAETGAQHGAQYSMVISQCPPQTPVAQITMHNLVGT